MLLASIKASRKHRMFTLNTARDSYATQQSHCLGLGSLLRRYNNNLELELLDCIVDDCSSCHITSLQWNMENVPTHI